MPRIASYRDQKESTNDTSAVLSEVNTWVLQAACSANGSALARLRIWNASTSAWETSTLEETVYEEHGEEWASGDYVKTIYVAGADRDEIISGTRKATWIEGTADGAFTTSSATVTITVTLHSGDGRDPGASVTVKNRTASTNKIFEGDSGDYVTAIYRVQDDSYYIVGVECP